MAIIVGYVEMFSTFLLFLILWHFIKNINSPTIRDWPIVGVLPGLLHNAWRINEYATQVLLETGGTFHFKGTWFANANFIVTSNPANVHHILSKNFANYPKGSVFKQNFEPLGDGIFRSDFDDWKTHRKLMQKVMKNASFELFVAKTLWRKVEKGLTPVLEQFFKLGIVVDMQDLFQRFTFDCVCLTTLGFDSNCLSVELPTVPYEKAFDDMEEAVFYRYIMPEWYWKLQKWLQIGEEKKLARAWETFDRFLYESISLKQQKLKRSKSQMEEEEFNLLTAIMAEEPGREIDALEKSNKFLRDHAFNLIAAGRDTVSIGLSWFFWLVATVPSMETKILEEIKEKLPEVKFTCVEDLNELVYLHAALCETFRLYPPIPFIHRTAVESDILPSGHRVHPNTRMLISVYSMGRKQEIWGEDCLAFKPERWITERGDIMYVPSSKFTAFNAGARTCLGKEMTFIQMKIIAVAVIWNYHVEVEEGHLVSPSNSIILQMKDGLKVRITKRSG